MIQMIKWPLKAFRRVAGEASCANKVNQLKSTRLVRVQVSSMPAQQNKPLWMQIAPALFQPWQANTSTEKNTSTPSHCRLSKYREIKPEQGLKTTHKLNVCVLSGQFGYSISHQLPIIWLKRKTTSEVSDVRVDHLSTFTLSWCVS